MDHGLLDRMSREALEGLLEAVLSTGYAGSAVDEMIALLDALDGDCDLEDAPHVRPEASRPRVVSYQELRGDLRLVVGYLEEVA